MKALVLEGLQEAHMRGWRHILIITMIQGKIRTNSVVATQGSAEKFAEALQGKFFKFGTWEAAGYFENKFPSPRPEIFALLKGGAS